MKRKQTTMATADTDEREASYSGDVSQSGLCGNQNGHFLKNYKTDLLDDPTLPLLDVHPKGHQVNNHRNP